MDSDAMVKTNWIKMRSSLLNHPRVISMVNHLSNDEQFLRFVCDDYAISAIGDALHNSNVSVTDLVTRSALRYVTVAGLLSLWSNARMFSDGGIIEGIGIDDLDEMAGVPGLGKAIEKAGWAKYDSERKCVILKDFTEWNDQDFKCQPKTNSERQKEWRERQKMGSQLPVTNRNESNDREEKRREENNTPAGRKIGEKPSTLDEKAADLATEFHFHFQGRKPVLDDLRTGFREKLRHYGEDRFDAILEAIKGDRDKTQYFLGFWIWLEKTNPPTPTIKPYEIVKTKDQLKYEATLERLRLQEEAKKNAS